jgi:2-polyprenyl-3-methyl-5-hydroxy-6-metoxy-1,4-benzoquinol methylase
MSTDAARMAFERTYQLACPACGYDESHPSVKISRQVTDRYGFEWWLSACGRCGLEWQSQPLTTEARQQFYGSGEYRRLCEQVTGKPWTDPAFLREQQELYARQWETDRGMRFHLPGGRWLDFGGSTGVVSRIWCEEMWPDYRRYFGGDDPKQPVITVADYGDGATVTPEQAIDLGRQHPYDAVICAQTLDHLPNPLDMLRTFRAITREGGVLFVDVVKREHTALKVDHDTFWPSAACFVGCVERAGWTVNWMDNETNPTHYTIGATR